jgi:hypothetical protein
MEIFFYILLSIAVGILASNRGRSGFLWFVLSIFLTPLVGFIFALVSKNLADDSQNDEPDFSTHVRCPDCRELVLKGARKCKHCGCILVPQ